MRKPKWKGSKALSSLLVPVTEIQTHPDNARRGNLDLIAGSLRAYGQRRPIVVNVAKWRLRISGSPVIIAGNHVYLAAVEKLEWDEIAVLRDEFTRDDEIGFLVADNRASDVGRYYDEKLAALLTRIVERGKLAGTGWAPEQAKRFIEQATATARRVAPGPEIPPGPPDVPRGEKADGERPPLVDRKLRLDRESARNFDRYVKIVRKEKGEAAVGEAAIAGLRDAAYFANQQSEEGS